MIVFQMNYQKSLTVFHYIGHFIFNILLWSRSFRIYVQLENKIKKTEMLASCKNDYSGNTFAPL